MTEHTPLSPVVSLEEFRSRYINAESAQPETLNGQNTFNGYTIADYTTFRNTRDMLTDLNAEATPGTLILATRFVTKSCVRVVAMRDTEGWGYLVDKDQNELECLTLDLELGDEEQEAALREPIERFYVATLVAGHALQRENRVKPSRKIANPTIGEIEVDPTKYGESMLLWRAAAGLGVLAVGKKRTTQRGEIKRYLQELLVNRFDYAVGRGRLSAILGRGPDDGGEIDAWLLGVTNPLNQFELMEVLEQTKLQPETTNPDS